MAYASTSAATTRTHSHPEDSDDESTQYSTNVLAKRRRLDQDGYSSSATPSVGSSPPQSGPSYRNKGKGKAVDGRGGDEQSDDSEDEVETLLLQTQPAGKSQRIRKTAEEPRSQIAEAGIILSIKLTNFMSHKMSEYKLGPQMNFLVGNNGSGKSAITTAITLALGGNINATGRGAKMDKIVRDGAPFAICSVQLKNQGPDAYEAEKFGDSITIERRINRGGGGSYRVRNNNGSTVDRNKAAVDKILDHFEIQVENPLVILTQDASRDFLANSSESEKYKFFLQGVGLFALSESYQATLYNIKLLKIATENKRSQLVDIEEDFRAADAKAKDASAIQDQVERKKELRNEEAWEHVVSAEEKLEEGQALYESELAKDVELQEELQKATADRDADSLDLDGTRRVAENIEEDDKALEITTLKTEIRKHAEDMKLKNQQKRDSERDLRQLEDQIAAADSSIAQAKLNRGNDDRQQQPILDELERLDAERKANEKEREQTSQDTQEAEEACRAGEDEEREAKGRLSGAEQQVSAIKRRIANLQKSTSNKLYAYGPNVPKLVESVRQAHWSAPVIGPVGTRVTVRFPEYCSVLETVLGGSLGTWIVQNTEDYKLMVKLSKQANCNVNIARLKHDDRNFNVDCSRGEPHQDILTVLRALDFVGETKIERETVFQYLVMNNRIESAALVGKRNLGDNLLRTNPRNVSTCYSGDGFQLTGSSRAMSSMTLNTFTGAPKLSTDVTQQVEKARQELTAAEQEVRRHQDFLTSVRKELATARSRKRDAEVKRGQLHRRKTEIENRRNVLQAKLDSDAAEPSNLTALEDLRTGCLNELDSLRSQSAALVDATVAFHSKLAPLTRKKEELEAIQTQNIAKQRRVDRKVEEADRKLQASERRLAACEKAKKLHDTTLCDISKDVRERELEVETCEANARQLCEERPEVGQRKSAVTLRQEIVALEKKIRDYAREAGQTPEEVFAERKQLKKTLTSSRKICKSLDNLLEASSSDSFFEKKSSADIWAYIAPAGSVLSASDKGFLGKMKIDHGKQDDKHRAEEVGDDDLPLELHDRRKKGHLALSVQTENMAGSAAKQAHSLSGGEKSFATISMLLAMWDEVGCPFRVLDEFDVFMDEVNRRLSMGLLVDSATKRADKQFILITPKSVTGKKWPESVHIIRLADPGRESGSLAAGA
ncbi:structural maintenance of chromosomes protein 6, partial [Phenoliferia sp. Uapishka_3]